MRASKTIRKPTSVPQIQVERRYLKPFQSHKSLSSSSLPVIGFSSGRFNGGKRRFGAGRDPSAKYGLVSTDPKISFHEAEGVRDGRRGYRCLQNSSMNVVFSPKGDAEYVVDTLGVIVQNHVTRSTSGSPRDAFLNHGNPQEPTDHRSELKHGGPPKPR